MTAKLPKRILWAVDAFTEDKTLVTKMGQILKAWTKGLDVVIEPICVLSPDQLKVSADLFTDLSIDFRKVATERLEKMIGKLKIKGLMKPTLLMTNSFALRQAVKELVAYGHQTGADLLVVGTHSRKGVTRFLFGSFAETLILVSNIPTFVISPKTKPTSGFKHILYPTDCTELSRQVFPTVLQLAKEHKAKVTVFHKIDYITEYTLATIQSAPVYQGFMKEDVKRREAFGESLIALAKFQGVKAEFVMNAKVAPVTDSVVGAAKRLKCDLIAVASQTGPVATALLGSITRQILRSAQVPVWVVHPGKEAEPAHGSAEALRQRRSEASS